MAHFNVHKGMQVYGADNALLGTVEDASNGSFVVNGKRLNQDTVASVKGNILHLKGSGDALRVPVVEEQLSVGKREVEAGAVRVHKDVVQEQVSIPVELRHEEVNVQTINTPDRPLRAGETAFQEQTYEVKLMGEEAVVSKTAVVTGEVVIDKTQTVEQRQISDSVRKERVEVEQVAATDVRQQTSSTMQPTTFNHAQLQPGFTVYDAQQNKVGTIKEIRTDGLVVSRGGLQGDTLIPLSAILSANGDRVMLNLAANQVGK